MIPKLLLTSLFLLLSQTPPTFSKGEEDSNQFFKDCPPSHCGSGSLEIRFPLRLRTSPRSCGLEGLELTCAGNDTLLSLPSLPPYKLTYIDYAQSLLTIDFGSGSGSDISSCPLRNLSFFQQFSTPIFSPVDTTDVIFFGCSKEIKPDPRSNIAGPIRCLSGSDRVVYVVDGYESMDQVPSDCRVVPGGGEIPLYLDSGSFAGGGKEYKSFALGGSREVSLRWSVSGVTNRCGDCEVDHKPCGFDWARKESFCQSSGHHGLHAGVIVGPSISGLVILAIVSFIFFYISRQSVKEKETRLKVERFLATYKSTKPTRYTYSGIKKITKRFKHRLGQGGFGSVYKGQLPNGIPVAVKMLEKSKGEGEEFINEVSTIGRIHHVNIVRLLGFCAEGTRHALIYEFMPNNSLEKYIFLKEDIRAHQRLSMEKLQDIAIGIAQGIEYLHQGCDQRILHFDIKPHNILLDHNFNPKISDFGLAKLCSRDISIVTMTAARGTMGYIAPEIYSRNFGTVSYKSDVYSFGMLLLEMVSGKKNVDPAIENQSDVYFPEWVYDQLINDEDLGLATERGKEEDIAKKLVIVALWCIQWSPIDRPSMTRVVQLLMGNLESLDIPPKPFVSSADQDNASVIIEA